MLKSLAIAGLALALGGCLVSVDSNSRPLQTTWDEAEVSRLQVGQTDRQWVRDSFGEPSTKLTYADGSEIWKYRNRSEKDVEVGLLFIFSVDVEEERVATLAIEFADGIVSNYWIEESR